MPVAKSTRVLTEARVRQIISALIRKETRKAFSSSLTDLLSVNTPIVIDNPGSASAAIGFDLNALSTSTPVAADEMMIYDLDLATERKITVSDLTNTVKIGVTFDGGLETIGKGAQGVLRIEDSFTLTEWYLLSDQIGSIVIDVWLDTFANYPPTIADTITASNKPTLSSTDKASDVTLTGWTTTVTSGDVIKFNVDSVTDIQQCTLILIGTKT